MINNQTILRYLKYIKNYDIKEVVKFHFSTKFDEIKVTFKVKRLEQPYIIILSKKSIISNNRNQIINTILND